MLGIVSDDYEVVDQRDAFGFLDAVIRSELHFRHGRHFVGRPARLGAGACPNTSSSAATSGDLHVCGQQPEDGFTLPP